VFELRSNNKIMVYHGYRGTTARNIYPQHTSQS